MCVVLFSKVQIASSLFRAVSNVWNQSHTPVLADRLGAMSTKDLLSLSVLVVAAVLLYKCYNFHITQEQMFSAGRPNINFSKRMMKDMTKSEICMGRRCAAPSQQEQLNADFLISSVVLSLIGLAIHLTAKHERGRAAARAFMRKANVRRRAAAEAFKRAAHSTSIACSSLSPSPVPRMKRPSAQNRPVPRQNGCKIPWDRMAKSSDYEVCLSLHPSPLPSNSSSINSSSDGSYSISSSSTNGVFPCAPPRRWRGNSRLNLATSPEVVPREVDLYYHL